MTTALVVLVLIGLVVWLSAARPSLPLLTSYDRDRQLAELRAMGCSRADVHL
ncbi:hypothetical protein [Pseudonocardia abyssalis]|uniref:Uncharacterized protein n=1 Tax=Pseudonocardia abyssalis TaxID=2792008 RepID=A0ABS6UN20_9PSEU|nr:hypothetical protein [Pseudonocardia abyssalis]MBW0115611.1 hypothetical protein [Pseudonocardia abyssalis]MBW0133346.1 hypothetical protein [Pseudonocardia abyssalis]